jgi:hypothetical protein
VLIAIPPPAATLQAARGLVGLAAADSQRSGVSMIDRGLSTSDSVPGRSAGVGQQTLLPAAAAMAAAAAALLRLRILRLAAAAAAAASLESWRPIVQVPQRPPRPPLTAPGRWVGAMDVEPSHHPPAPAQLRRTLSSRTHRSDIGTWAETPRAGGGGPQRTTSMPRPGHFRLRDQPGYHAVPTGTLRGPGVQRPHSMLLKSASPMPGVRGGAHDVTSPAWQADSDVAGRVPYVSPIRSLPVSHSRSSLPAMRCTTRHALHHPPSCCGGVRGKL